MSSVGGEALRLDEGQEGAFVPGGFQPCRGEGWSLAGQGERPGLCLGVHQGVHQGPHPGRLCRNQGNQRRLVERELRAWAWAEAPPPMGAPCLVPVTSQKGLWQERPTSYLSEALSPLSTLSPADLLSFSRALCAWRSLHGPVCRGISRYQLSGERDTGVIRRLEEPVKATSQKRKGRLGPTLLSAAVWARGSPWRGAGPGSDSPRARKWALVGVEGGRC